MPGAVGAQVRLDVPDATRLLAETLQADSIPVARVVERDGLVESGWFSVAGRQPFRGRPLGTDVVQVRGWVDPGKAGHSVYTVETVYRVMADPSRPDRELERQVTEDHPVAIRVDESVRKLLYQWGDPDDIKADSAARAFRRFQAGAGDSTAARPDTAAARPDTTTTRRDTTATRPDTSRATPDTAGFQAR